MRHYLIKGSYTNRLGEFKRLSFAFYAHNTEQATNDMKEKISYLKNKRIKDYNIKLYELTHKVTLHGNFRL